MPQLQRRKIPNIVIINRMIKSCAICGTAMKVILYNDRSYRGGHYFFRTPLKACLRRRGSYENRIGRVVPARQHAGAAEPQPAGRRHVRRCERRGNAQSVIGRDIDNSMAFW